ncbi:MAG: 1-(5-phosphoribosyl)-5-[(5-phosphoribosylamino)methylideneamino]imidazole-4-carboxamide isomerase [Magnetococcales bacterium]|nr:1-(5-phosphoribosyl)-5-[(5-phosphoribosylamino)methylideneamino]imidazole-4-carboxamide isomerase [Magnetococcales bacterium]MBF0150211.1 1-(5-phosphoribosyl)-5-[(5-phosphoribosylamino)methylideneamino]imidazole-4-carboxamide isomerase [Magnetococcales bacterium]MBF0174777.1 1-(5-phosphoribosyl)-5-[(5-phosphoribosylamino)methylideneamino]imidazole-4-carboxamide isomerase [Magnetococcales bacterium]MBF0347901.1 1-(5-phosphoribosyl)-5-[(5-phosphoribosylamino)methylideneamino]imidazole-4-carboxa
MIVIPAIDLKDGKCVRLFQGDMHRDTVYSDNPGAMALRWQGEGAERLHVVDLNGAFAGARVNQEAVEAILKAITIPVQLGGGIRDLHTIEALLKTGIFRVILGTIACRNPALVHEACRLFPGRISVGIDARGGKVAIQGWAEVTDMEAVALARRFEDAGVAEIIFTDIARDGALTGANLPATIHLAQTISIPVILSGGVAGIEDIEAAITHAGPFPSGGRISGVITGKAIYDGRLDFKAALLKVRQMQPKNETS